MASTPLRRLIFLVHPFCYAGVRAGEANWRYALREQACARKWLEGASGLREDEAMALIPTRPEGHAPTEEFIRQASAAIGERCIPLRCPYWHQAEFWAGLGSQAQLVLDDLQEAYMGQRQDWNKEELYTALHSRLCVERLRSELEARGLRFDPATLECEAWGESFDGCVTKYSLNLRRLLGLAKPIKIDFERSVPDAPFLVDAQGLECLDVAPGLHLFLFLAEGRPTGLYVADSSSMGDPARTVSVSVDPDHVTVATKQGGRLWPLPVDDRMKWPSIGVTEPQQELVRWEAGRLILPVSFGLVYRLAKSPFCLMAGIGTSSERFREQLVRCVVLKP